MHEAASTPKVHEILNALEDLLTQETQALVRLDADSVESLSKQKLSLTSTLSTLDPRSLREEQPRLNRLRNVLRNNLVLLAHAREYVTVKIRTLNGGPVTIEPKYAQVSQSSRLNVRG
jgi:flagellar biosynthesis/type III secretory pathway chaperone